MSNVLTADEAKEKIPRLHDEPAILVLDNLEDVLSVDTDKTRELLFRLTHKKNLCLIFTIRRDPKSWGSIPASRVVRPQALTTNDIHGLFSPKISEQAMGFLVKRFQGQAQSLKLMANAWNDHQPWKENVFLEEIERNAEQMAALGNGSDVSPLATAVAHTLKNKRLSEDPKIELLLAAFTWITTPTFSYAWLENALISSGHRHSEIKHAIALLREFTLVEKIIHSSSEETEKLMILQNHRQALKFLRKDPAIHADFIGRVLLEIEKEATTGLDWKTLASDYNTINRVDLAKKCLAQIRHPSRLDHQDQEYERIMEEGMAEAHIQSQEEDAYVHFMEDEANRLMVEAAEEEAFMNYGQDMAGQIHLHEEEWDESFWNAEMADVDAEREYWAEYADAVVNDELWDLYDKDDEEADDAEDKEE